MTDDSFAERIPADSLMKYLLDEVGFDFDRPEPILALVAFQRFVAQPLTNLATNTVGWECEHSERDDRLWLCFERSIEAGWLVGCQMSAIVPQDMRDVLHSYWHWEEHETLAEWFDIVEASPVFWRALSVGGWRWEDFG